MTKTDIRPISSPAPVTTAGDHQSAHVDDVGDRGADVQDRSDQREDHQRHVGEGRGSATASAENDATK